MLGLHESAWILSIASDAEGGWMLVTVALPYLLFAMPVQVGDLLAWFEFYSFRSDYSERVLNWPASLSGLGHAGAWISYISQNMQPAAYLTSAAILVSEWQLRVLCGTLAVADLLYTFLFLAHRGRSSVAIAVGGAVRRPRLVHTWWRDAASSYRLPWTSAVRVTVYFTAMTIGDAFAIYAFTRAEARTAAAGIAIIAASVTLLVACIAATATHTFVGHPDVASLWCWTGASMLFVGAVVVSWDDALLQSVHAAGSVAASFLGAVVGHSVRLAARERSMQSTVSSAKVVGIIPSVSLPLYSCAPRGR